MQVQKVIRGQGCLKKLPELMEKTGMKHPLIVGSERLAGKIRSREGLAELPLFSGYHPNPDLKDALAGRDMYLREKCDGLISIGGGSAMDTAKAIKAYLAAAPEDVRANRLPERMPEGLACPHIAIPGTAGSGAEATANGVLYAEGTKLSIGGSILLPEGVALDSSLLETLPEYHRKSCAFDALAQGIESYWSAASTEDSRVHAYLAILGVLDNVRAYLAGDPHAADEMMDASYQSGRAILLTRTTAAHAMSYQITKRLGLAHGHAVMVTLPVLWDLLLDRGDENTQERMKELASVMRLGDPRMGSRLLRGMMYDLQMAPPSLPDRETMEHLVDSVNTERLGNFPVKLEREDLRRVYTMAFLPMGAAERQACLDIWTYYGGQGNERA